MLLMLSHALSVFIVIIARSEQRFAKPSVYQKIRQNPKLSRFASLLELNRPAKLNLQYGEMTVFAPTNEAFEWYSAGNLYEVTNYHMVWYAKALNELKEGPLSSMIEENPPVWVTKVNGETFVNNAKLVPELSDYVAEISSEPKKTQVLHVIDEVLNPVVKRAPMVIINPTAFDFLLRSVFWDIGPYKVQQFYRAVVNAQEEGIFKSSGSNTYFIPIDDYDFHQELDSDTISGHVIPNRVLFTRPAAKDIPYETLSNGETLYVVLMLTGAEGQLSVRSNTLISDSNHTLGEITTEIVRANIPVKNGVVHLIKRPLVVVGEKLSLFPFLPVMDKVQSDPTLSITHSLGNRTGFNELLESTGAKLTYFVPRNKAWTAFAEYLEANQTFVGDFADKYGRSILNRHVIVANVSYTIEDLQRRSNVSETADINIHTMGGILQIGIGESDGTYVIYWRDKFVPVYRANWVCSNGIIHIIDDMFVTKDDIKLLEEREESNPNPLKVLNMLMRIML